jgi:hypothetical protein
MKLIKIIALSNSEARILYIYAATKNIPILEKDLNSYIEINAAE